MVDLRRGMPFYPGGGFIQPPLAPVDTSQQDSSEAPATSTAPADVATPADVAAPAAPAAPSGFSQLMGRQFTEAQQNPESSQATRALATFADYVSRHIRAQNLTNVAPSPLDRLMNVFTGNPASAN